MEDQSEDQSYSGDSEEAKNINKSLASVNSRRKKNEIVIGTVALIIFVALGLTDKIGEAFIIWLPIELIRIAIILFFVIMEHRAFEKYLQKKYPSAFPE